jgi:hypothetical protein
MFELRARDFRPLIPSLQFPVLWRRQALLLTARDRAGYTASRACSIYDTRPRSRPV